MKNVLLLSVTLLLCLSCSMQEHRNPCFDRVHQLLPQYPDSALAVLNNEITTQENATDKAIAALLTYYIHDLSQYHYYNEVDLKYIIRHDNSFTDPHDIALFRFYKGTLMMKEMDYKNAIENFHQAEHIATKQGWDHLLGMIYNKSSEVFYEMSLYHTSILYADKSYAHFMKCNDDKFANCARANKIFSLLELWRYDEAEELYEETKAHILQINDMLFLTYFYSEILSIYVFYDELDKAEKVYKDLEAHKGTEGAVFPIEHLYLGRRYIETAQYDSVQYHLNEADKGVTAIYDVILLKYVFSRYYKSIGQYDVALEYMDEHIALLDSAVGMNQRTSLVELEAQSNFFMERLDFEKKTARQERYFFVSTIAIVLLAGGLFAYRKHITKQKEAMKDEIALVSGIVSELKNSNQNLLSKLNMQKANESLLKQQIEDRLEYSKMFSDLYYRYQGKPGLVLQKMNEMIDIMPHHKEFQANIIQSVNLYYNNVLERLTKAHPDLNCNEVLFSALIIAGFSLQEMSLILSCNSVDAVYMRKSRLKQKLLLQKGVDLEHYLLGFLDISTDEQT